MSSYLWRYFLENDAEQFRRLLEGSRTTTHTAPLRHTSRQTGLAPPTSPSSSKLNAAFSGKQNTSSLPGNVVLTRQILRELDAMGRSILHLACSSSKGLPFVVSLLSHPLTDPAVADLESGWTAMHRALYHGNISAARDILWASPSNCNLVKLKDHAGDTPFEVYSSSVYGLEDVLSETSRAQKEEEIDRKGQTQLMEDAGYSGDEVFSWGSNKNLTLGFSDSDDRSYPERVPIQRPRSLLLEQAKLKYSHLPENNGKGPGELLDATILFKPQRIIDMQLSKLHTVILTDDPHSNLFVCGFGRGGRLGFGDEQNTQFTLRPLTPPLLPKKKVKHIAVGLDHTVAILSDGEVWTWGGNQWGQLGYTLQQKTPKVEPIQTTPRQVFGLLKKERVVGCAASRIHTVVFTSDSLFSFGKNEGQLGILDSSDARTLTSQSTPRKVAANFLTGLAIQDVSALEKATAILLENHEVWIFAGYGYSKLSFSMERFAGLPARAVMTTHYDNQLNVIHKITGSGDILCALSRMGDVFTIDVNTTLKERAERGVAKAGWTTQRAWGLRKRHMAVRDVAVGAEGSIIICTQSGSVWKRVKRVKVKEGGGDSGRYKFDRVAGLTRIVAVRSSSTGAFAAIRKDCDVMKTNLAVKQQGLWDDIAGLMSLKDIFENEDMDDASCMSQDDEWGDCPTPRPSGVGKATKWFMRENVVDELKHYLIQLDARGHSEEWDMAISTTACEGVEVPVHRAVFARSPVLRKLFAQGFGEVDGFGSLVYAAPGERVKLVLHHLDILTLLSLVYYMYVDTVIDFWHQRGISKPKASKYKMLRTELASVASSLELKPFADAIGRTHYLPRTMDTDFRSAYSDQSFFGTTDMAIDVGGGETLKVHSAIMRARCPFFDALYSGGASGRWLLGRRVMAGDVHADMKHVPPKVMGMVISWLYYDWGVEGFDGVRNGVDEDDVDQYLDFVLEVLSVANELMLERLSQVCQAVIGGLVNTRNAAELLTAIAGCSEKMFKEGCLQYICLNLENMLENHLLDEIDEDLMAELDETVRSNQRQLYPSSRTNKQERMLKEKYPFMHEATARERATLIANYMANEDEYQLSGSLKGRTSFLTSSPSSTPSFQKSRRKSSKVVSRKTQYSSARPVHLVEEIFHMDADEEENSFSACTAPPLETATALKRVDSKGKAPTIHPLMQKSPSPAAVESSKTAPIQAPWITPIKSSKLGMKEIMEQAAMSATGKSALTAQLTSTTSPKVDTGTNFKLSQKERKRREQQQLSLPTIFDKELHLEHKDKKPAWKIPADASGPQVSLKEMLTGTSSSSHSFPQPSTSFPRAQPSPTPSGRIKPVSTSATILRTMPSSNTGFHLLSADRRGISHDNTLTSPLGLRLGLDDIIYQEKAQKQAIEEFKMKKSLQEIQQEQEFLRWWDNESLKVQMAEKASDEASHGCRRVHGRECSSNSSKRGRSRGRGGRGRGRGRQTTGGAPAAIGSF